MNDNFLRRVHTDSSGRSQLVVSMAPEHLVAMVNLIFRRKLKRCIDEARVRAMSGFAPEGMPDKVRRSMGLEKVSAREIERIERSLDGIHTRYLEDAMEEFWHYVVVGVMRDDTRDGVIKILQDAFGVSGRIDVPIFEPLQEDDDDVLYLESGWDQDPDGDDPLEQELRDHYSGGGE